MSASKTKEKRYRVAVLGSHAVHYRSPLFQRLAARQEIELGVYFFCKWGVRTRKDPEFGRTFKWDLPLLKGFRYKFLKNYGIGPRFSFFGQINPSIVKEILFNKYDAILVYGWNYFSSWLAFITAFIIKTPVFLHGENPLNQELLKSDFKRKIKKVILGRLFKRISTFLYIGEENKKFYQHYGVPEERLFFCPYAVDNARFINKAREIKNQKSKIKNELGINSKDVIILFVGKFIEKKRPFDLLKAYELLNMGKSDFPNIDANVRKSDFQKLHLIFVGDGVLRPELENYSKKHNIKKVHFLGFKNQTELHKYYAMADIFVLPSGAGETWGLVVNEAMCFELPIIVSDLVGCAKDLVGPGENGYVFPLGDVDKLAQYLAELIENSEKRKLFGKKSFKIIQNYSYENDVKGILKALQY